MIELTDEQLQHLNSDRESPPRVVNPQTQETFVLVRSDIYELVRKIVEGANRRGWDDSGLDDYEQYRKQA